MIQLIELTKDDGLKISFNVSHIEGINNDGSIMMGQGRSIKVIEDKDTIFNVLLHSYKNLISESIN